MKLIVGLGNPEKKYEKTRHNVGFLAVDYVFKQLTTDNPHLTSLSHWKKNKKSNALIASITPQDEKLLFVQPQTYMNNSGLAVKTLITHYELLITNDVIVIHDDIDIPFGKFKIQKNRGPAGHNGVKSIIDHLGTRDFTRVRIGVLPTNIDKSNIDTQSFVLKNFSQDELKELNKTLFPNILEKLVGSIVAEPCGASW